MEKELNLYNRNKNKIFKTGRKSTTKRKESYHSINNTTFGDELLSIKENIYKDISECNAKQEKDIIILIDFNIYNKIEKNIQSKKLKIDAFAEETITILNDYLSSNDRLSVIVYKNKYRIICPLMKVNNIDNDNFSKDLIYYKNNSYKENNGINESDFNSEIENEYKFYLDENNQSSHSEEESLEFSGNEEINYDEINGLVNAINFLNKYSKVKEEINNEKYIIIFSNIFDINLNDDMQIEKIFDNINGDKNCILLLVGKNKRLNKKNENSKFNEHINYIEELILRKFGEKSEIIFFENMKKIKTILSNNKVIKDEIFYPNEIYK